MDPSVEEARRLLDQELTTDFIMASDGSFVGE
jgi:hypothetical protein